MELRRLEIQDKAMKEAGVKRTKPKRKPKEIRRKDVIK